jgi:hypothetical protein
MTVTLPEPQAWLDDVKTRCVEVEVSKDGYEFETFVTLLDATANVHADTRDGTTAHIVSRDSYVLDVDNDATFRAILDLQGVSTTVINNRVIIIGFSDAGLELRPTSDEWTQMRSVTAYMQKNKYGEMEPIQGAFRKYRVTVRP